MNEINIYRIPDLGISAGGINLKHSFMKLSLAVRVLYSLSNSGQGSRSPMDTQRLDLSSPSKEERNKSRLSCLLCDA